MKFSLEQGEAHYRIKSYSGTGVSVLSPPTLAAPNVIALDAQSDRPRLIEEQLTASFIIAPSHLIRDWPPRSFTDLTEAHLHALAEFGAEIVILGTGARARLPNPAWMAFFGRRGVGLETMDTGAACRTYNVLMAEGRRVVAGIFVD